MHRKSNTRKRGYKLSYIKLIPTFPRNIFIHLITQRQINQCNADIVSMLARDYLHLHSLINSNITYKEKLRDKPVHDTTYIQDLS
jgi:hypothetical protein